MHNRQQWVKPSLVRKPVQETFSGLGAPLDGRGEVQS